MKAKGIILAAVGLALLMALLPGCGKAPSAPEWESMDALKAYAPEEIESVRFQISSEGGVMGDTVTDPAAIEEIYQRLCGVTVDRESNMGVEDYGTDVYVSVDGKTLSFYFEADILVLDNARYEVKNLGPLRQYLRGLLGEDE